MNFLPYILDICERFKKFVILIILCIYLNIAQLLPAAVHVARGTSSAVNEPTRPKRLINPAPVRHGFIPEEWFQAFYPKTGASGN
jgi:hypothetical protein